MQLLLLLVDWLAAILEHFCRLYCCCCEVVVSVMVVVGFLSLSLLPTAVVALLECILRVSYLMIFGAIICAGQSRGCPLRGLLAFPDAPSQVSRYTSLGWNRCSVVDMNFIYNEFIPKDRVRRYIAW